MSFTPEIEELDVFPIVGIGASAGGLEAFRQLLRHLPPDTGMAFVLIQHLDPKHDSLLSEILTRTTDMSVYQVEDGMAIAPNCVYVIPPDTCMTLERETLKLKPREMVNGRYMAIDGFLSSLAEERLNKAIAIVLSGSNEDGTVGLAAVKSNGGITFAQDLQSSEFPTMPQSAIASGYVDFVLSPAEIAAELVKISRHPYVKCPDLDLDRKNPESQPLATISSVEISGSLPQIFGLLRSQVGVNFSNYKQGTIKRRIMRRMVLHNLANLENYVQYLQENPSEVKALYHDILINVTSFFRDVGSFEALSNHVFPTICQDKSFDTPIRIWIAGCSTGEEAYSIAMSLLEYLDDRPLKPPIQIFATDISEVTIERARQGIYPQTLLAEVSPERLRRFFVPVDRGYQISKAVRELCVFARQNLISDPPFSRLDLISCRNVLIYMEPVLQKKVMPIFHYALKPTGFLMLGTSESIGEFSDLFEIADKKYRIYAHKQSSNRLNLSFVTNNFNNSPAEKSTDMTPEAQWNESSLEQAADRLLLQQYAPTGVIVNSDLEILQFRGNTSPYLEPSPGKASLNLLKMVRSALILELRTAIHRAKQENLSIRREGLLMGDQRINLIVTPLQPRLESSPEDDRFFLVLFENNPSGLLPTETGSNPKPRKVRQTESDREIMRLQQELATTKEYLQSIIETQESSNQDLKVANEEILSSNEELQSTNEELETAKEEIQATNEELSTINDELRNRNLQVNQINNDLQNLLSSVNIPILMVSGDLQIRRFTIVAEQLFNLISSDIGRPFSDIHSNLNVPNLVELIVKTIDTLNTYEQEVQDNNGRWYQLRIRPYKTMENQIDGAVISLIDINALKRSAMLLETAIVETVRSPLIVLNAGLEVITANRAFYETFRLLPTQTERQQFWRIGRGEWHIPQLRSLLTDMLNNQSYLQDFEVTINFGELGDRIMLLNASPIIQPENQTPLEPMILIAIEDITARRNAEVEIRNSLQEKEILLHEIRHRVKNNLQIISSLLSLQSYRVNNSEAVKILRDSQNRVQTISLMYEVLHQSAQVDRLDFAEYMQSLVAYLLKVCNLNPQVTSKVSIPAEISIDPDRALLVGLIVNELVTNALKYGFIDRDSGEVAVEFKIDRDHITLEVSNDGNSFPSDFDLATIQSVGLNLVKRLVMQLNGTLHFYHGDRTIIEINFPLNQPR